MIIHHETIVVSGKVQGVFFRASAKEQADQLALKGNVRNLADGRVYIEAEGTAESLIAFRGWCVEGPPGALVNSVEFQRGELSNYDSFTIIR